MSPGERIVAGLVVLALARLAAEPPGRRRTTAEGWAVLVFLVGAVALVLWGALSVD